MKLRVIPAILLWLFAAVAAPAVGPGGGGGASSVPGMINYQGRIVVQGNNFNGTGQFKFALVDAEGQTTFWSNDGSSSQGSEPTGAVSVEVAAGLYSLLLGDSSMNNMTSIPASVFGTHDDVRLRIWFDDGAHGSQLLTPDQRFGAVAYAAMAATVPDGSITSEKIADGAITAAQLGTGTISGTVGCPGAVTADLGATVSIPGTGFFSTVGAVIEGHAPYALNNIPAGTYTVKASLGNGREESHIVAVTAGGTAQADFSMMIASCPDADGDGYGDQASATNACQPVAGYSHICTDFNDASSSSYPGAPEICDGLDNDGNGEIDDNTEGGIACSTGLPGACGAGTTTCQGGSMVCVQNASPSAEICDGLDNNCNGTTDEGNPGGGTACNTGNPGICATGTTLCQGGGIVCAQNGSASAEVCDGLDNNCNGAADEGNPGGGAACNTGEQGICASGTTLCQGGGIVCTQNGSASAEVCDGLDNNCNGVTDEGNPGGGAACNTGEQGICAAGTVLCQGGGLVCSGNQNPTFEVCNGLDDNCDGITDNGASCSLGTSCINGTCQ